MTTFFITIYVIGIFVAFICVYYKNLKLSRNGKNYYADIEPDMVIIPIFWPIALVVLIVILPFKLLCRLAEKLKKVNNPQNVNL
jgi:heme/copper-type cytochrome/quinol oxidase subunit 2